MELAFHWIRYAFIVWGLVYLSTQSSVFYPLRLVVLRYSTFFGTLVFCGACTGFWVGVVLGALGFYGSPLTVYSTPWLESGLVSTVLGYLWATHYGNPVEYTNALMHVGKYEAEVRSRQS